MKKICALLLCLATCAGLAQSTPPPAHDLWNGVKISEADSLRLENALLKIALAAQAANQQYTAQAGPSIEIRNRLVETVQKANPDYVWDSQHSAFVKKQPTSVAAPTPAKP